MDLEKYRQLFLDECREHLQVMNRELLRLEQQDSPPGCVDAIFRAAHSIKGMSGSMGYDAIVAVSHALEDILDRLRKQALAVDPPLMSLLYEGVDALGELALQIEEQGATRADVSVLAQRLRAAAAGSAAPAPPPVAPPAPVAVEVAAVPPPAPAVPVSPVPASPAVPAPGPGPELEFEVPGTAAEAPPAPMPAAVAAPEVGREAGPGAEPEPAREPEPAAAPAVAASEASPAPFAIPALELPPLPEVPPPAPTAPPEPAAAPPTPASPPAPPAAPSAPPEPAFVPAPVDVPAPVPAPAPAPAPAAAPVSPAEGPGGGDLVATRGGIFTLEPEKLAMVRDFVRSGLVPYACSLRVAKDAAALGARNFIILGRLAKAGMVLASSPTLEEVRAGGSREVVEALLLTERPEEDLRARLLAIPELRELQLRRLSIGSGGGAAPGAPAPPQLLAPRQVAVERPAGAGPGLADRYAPKKAATVRVDTRVLDDLINIVGEMLITRERLQEISRDLESEELHTNLDRLRVLVRDFQDTIMTVRMMPLDLVTDRLPRIVRDLAHQSGKHIGFEVLGKGIELDRAILEELNDVLLHLVRNAIDHGVEPPEQRAAAGKAEKAMVRLRAGRERDWVWIRVEDDGRGMDPERIARAAVGRGLVSAEKAEAMNVGAKLLLSCLPGVSTADKVTDISGRGVGMDVVKARVDAFGGTLQIDSQPGRGTAITLRLPLTLAIIRILLVEVRGQEYGLPVSHVLRTSQLDPADVEWSQQRPLLRLGRRLVPLVDLGGLLGLPQRDLREHPGLFLAVAEFGERAAGLAVDRLLGSYEVVVKPLGPPLKRVRGLSGVTVMGDGRTVLLLDLAALIEAR